MQGAGILAAVLFLLCLFGLLRSGLGRLRRRRFLFHLVQLGRRDKDRHLGQPVFCGLVAGVDEDLGIEVGICVAGDFPQLQRVFVAVVGDDMNVGRAVRDLRLDADKAAGDVAAIENPIHRISGKDVGNLLLGGKQDQRRLQESGADHRRRVRLGHGDGARRVRLKGLRRRCGRPRGRGSR